MDTGPRPLLAEVYVSDFKPGGAAAYVALANPGSGQLDLSWWTLEWGSLSLSFPEGAYFAGGGRLYIAHSADAFRQNLTRLPDYTVTPFPGVPALVASGDSGAAFDPARGHVRLLDKDGAPVDALVWGDATPPDGWTGPGVEPAEAGFVYLRAIDESTLNAASPGNFIVPGGAAEIWKQGTAWIPRREMRVGQGAFVYPTLEAASATAFAMPDGAFPAVRDFLDGARQSLDINIYLFTQDALADRVLAALERGVAVRMLMEGQPYEGMPPQDRNTIDRLQSAGAKVRVLRSTSEGFKRYHFTHAKYAVADGHLCLVMSDNWTRTSVPVTPYKGNRGWGIILESPDLARHLTRVFTFDYNPQSPDSLLLDPGIKMPEPVPSLKDQLEPQPLANPILPIRMDGPMSVTPILAPEHALLETRGIAEIIRGATRSLDIQQASLQLYWGFGDDGSMETMPNLFLDEIVAAARRGVHVRVLLDGQHLDAQDPRENTHTRDYLLNLADREHLPIEARILDFQTTRTGIHNKGAIADDVRVLISSVNWTQNSPLSNRELAVVVEHPAVAAYFGAVFDRDWAGGK